MRASDFTTSVLARPGTPSITAWPPQVRTTRSWSTTSFWPTITFASSVRTCLASAERCSTLIFLLWLRFPGPGLWTADSHDVIFQLLNHPERSSGRNLSHPVFDRGFL